MTEQVQGQNIMAAGVDTSSFPSRTHHSFTDLAKGLGGWLWGTLVLRQFCMLFLVKELIDQVMLVNQIQGCRRGSPKEAEAEGKVQRRVAGAGRGMAAPKDALSVNSDILKGG